MRISKETKATLLDPYHRKCPVCGRSDIDLHICHIVPMSAGGTDDIANLAVMCPSCLASFDRYQPTEMEFTAFLADLLNRHPDYSETRMESRLSESSPLRADLTTVEGKPKGKRSILVECKRAAFFTERRLRETITQIDMYQHHTRFDAYALAFPGRLPPQLKQLAVSAGVELWDVDFIATKFSKQVKSTAHPFFKGLLLSIVPLADQPPQIKLLDRLKNCHPGKDDWSDYQRLVGQIFEELFCPPLQAPLSESADAAGVNRRDLVFPNYADSGFWRFIREMYDAYYVVVDAKNYKAPVSKHQVLQIANYLKPHGAGMFAIIATRVGADKAACLTIREQWMVHHKMILIVDDGGIEAMLLAASSGGDPSKLIGQLIEDFRLSM